MSLSSIKATPSQTGSKVAGKGSAQAGEIDMSVFNLRDTLSNITVREANFSEFLSALKLFGSPAMKQ
ncbi:MAG: hypothetical protein Q8N89_04760 [Azonexus sp.]|nr:hypothetical protein [Azonexus sp.]